LDHPLLAVVVVEVVGSWGENIYSAFRAATATATITTE